MSGNERRGSIFNVLEGGSAGMSEACGYIKEKHSQTGAVAKDDNEKGKATPKKETEKIEPTGKVDSERKVVIEDCADLEYDMEGHL